MEGLESRVKSLESVFEIQAPGGDLDFRLSTLDESPTKQRLVGLSKKRLATAYSPATSQWQYHRRCRA
jgi:hypothetical protein